MKGMEVMETTQQTRRRMEKRLSPLNGKAGSELFVVKVANWDWRRQDKKRKKRMELGLAEVGEVGEKPKKKWWWK